MKKTAKKAPKTKGLKSPKPRKSSPRKTSPEKTAKKPAVRSLRASEIEELRIRLAEAEETLDAIRQGEVDALVVSAPHGEQVFTLKGAEHPYRVFFETMNEGGAVISAEGIILSCNGSLADMLRKDITKLPGMSFYNFLSAADRIEVEELILNICKTEGSASPVALRKEAVLMLSNSGRVPVQMAVSVKYEFDEAHICVVVTDLTNQKQAEEALRRSHDEIELKVLQRTAELKSSKDELQAQNAELNIIQQELQSQNEELQSTQEELQSQQEELQSQNEELLATQDELLKSTAELSDTNKELEAFTYSVSHDLRTPLRTMSGFARILLSDHAEKLDLPGKEHLSRIHKGAEKMAHLIEDLLNFSRLSRLEVKRGRVDLSRLALFIIEKMKEAEPDRKVEVDIKDDITASADHYLIEIVLSNLLGNAWKFTSKTEGPRIEFGALQQDGMTIYYVRDNGAGFDPDYKDSMFKPFHRLHSERDFEGTGIGLTIVERIIRRHGGKVWAEGEIGKGAAVYFTLR